MYLANSPNGNLSDEPLWLVVQHGQRSRVFELASSGDNTVVFGASNEADVKFSGMVPVALYLERDAKGVWLTPGYADSTLRVDGQPLQSRRPIYGKAVLESSGIKIVLCVRDTPPTLRGGASRCDDTTVIPRPANWGSMASDTREYSREELAWLFSDDEGAALGIDEFDGWFDSNAISGGFEKRSVAELKPQPLEGQRVSAQTPPSVDLSKVQRCSGDTTEYDGAAFRRLLTPKAPPIVASVVDNAALAVVTSTLTPLPLMARIGVLAKKNPLRVFLGASLGSLFLVVFMVGAVNLASGGNKPKTERGAAPQCVSRCRTGSGLRAANGSVCCSSGKRAACFGRRSLRFDD